MTRRRTASSISVLLAAALIAGCGSDDEKIPSAPANAPTYPLTKSTTTAGAPVSQTAIEACKSSLQANTRISKDIRKDLEDICEKAGSGDAKAARAASRAVCRRIIESSVPASAARDKALKSCDPSAK